MNRFFTRKTAHLFVAWTILAVFFFAMSGALTPQAGAYEVVGLLRFRSAPILTMPRDPKDFIEDLKVVLPRPVVVLTRQDAVAMELLGYTRTMSEQDVLRVAQVLCDESDRLGLDPLLLLAMIHVESYYDHLAISPRGAEGLMQLMPDTAEWTANKIDLEWPESHSFDPVLNVKLGAHYFDFLERQFPRLDVALTAYNRGPKATRFLLREHGKLPLDIREFYAAKVLDRYHKLRALYGDLPWV